MSIEIIGILPHRFYSEVYARPLEEFDTDLIDECARAHEAAGYDRVLIANSATYPDSMPIAAWVAGRTQRLKFMIAHRPGFVSPTMTARMLATIDRLSHGRCGVHIITGTVDQEMEADGDFLTKETRFERSREYVQILKRMWSSDAPFDHQGQFYRFKRGFCAVKPTAPGAIPVFWGGASEKGSAMGAEVADVFALNVAPKERLFGTIDNVRRMAAEKGRSLEFLLSARVVTGETEAAAWQTAHSHLEALVSELDDSGRLKYQPGETPGEARRRVFETAAEGSRDGNLFSAFGKVGIGRPVSNCLVGSVDQIVAHLMEFHRAGVSRFILAGYDPRKYPAEFGAALLPRLRAAVAGESSRTMARAV